MAPTPQERKLLDSLLGIDEVAALAGVQKETVYRWRVNEAMPAPDVVISRVPIWLPSTILPWLRETGRVDSHGQPVRRPN